MKALSILLGLLLTSPIYCFDTLSIEAGLQGIKTDARGITVYQYLELPTDLGAYVFEIKKLPGELHKHHIKVEEGGFNLLKVEWIKELPAANEPTDLQLFEQMQALRNRLKELDHQESESLRFKKELMSKMVNQHDIFSIRELYKEKDIALKKERIQIYNELQLIQNELVSIKDQFIGSESDTEGTLFLSIIKHQLDAKILRFNYFLAHPQDREGISNSDRQAIANTQKDSQLVKGRVIESDNRIPLVYALIEIYEGEEFVRSVYTDEMGIFETKLATNKNYSFIIYQEGYKDRKVKKFSPRASDQLNYRTYTMKEKNPISLGKVATYALQVAALIAYNW
jgi:hypothetical protein